MLSSNTLATWCEQLTHWKRSWCWGRLRAGGEGDDRGWDGWMASPTRWTEVWKIREIVKDKEVWRAAVPRVTKSQTTTEQRNKSGLKLGETWPHLQRVSVKKPSESFAAETCPVCGVFPNRAFRYCITVTEAVLRTHMNHCRRKYETKHGKPTSQTATRKLAASLVLTACKGSSSAGLAVSDPRHPLGLGRRLPAPSPLGPGPWPGVD